MATEESKVKRQVKALMKQYGPELTAEWLVPSGLGSPTLDCNGCYKGYAFKIETKAPGKVPTPRQEQTIAQWKQAGCKVFVIDGNLTKLRFWLDVIRASPSAATLIKDYPNVKP